MKRKKIDFIKADTLWDRVCRAAGALRNGDVQGAARKFWTREYRNAKKAYCRATGRKLPVAPSTLG